MPFCQRTLLQNHSYLIPLDPKHNLQQMSGKHVHYVLQLSNILHDAMTKIITTISPRENSTRPGSKQQTNERAMSTLRKHS